MALGVGDGLGYGVGLGDGVGLGGAGVREGGGELPVVRTGVLAGADGRGERLPPGSGERAGGREGTRPSWGRAAGRRRDGRCGGGMGCAPGADRAPGSGGPDAGPAPVADR
jgi:hypothetical protein